MTKESIQDFTLVYIYAQGIGMQSRNQERTEQLASLALEYEMEQDEG